MQLAGVCKLPANQIQFDQLRSPDLRFVKLRFPSQTGKAEGRLPKLPVSPRIWEILTALLDDCKPDQREKAPRVILFQKRVLPMTRACGRERGMGETPMLRRSGPAI